MKKAVLLAAACSILGLSSCCRVVDCCFEDPCVPTPSCSPCEEKKCGPCGGDAYTGPQVKGCSADGQCR